MILGRGRRRHPLPPDLHQSASAHLWNNSLREAYRAAIHVPNSLRYLRCGALPVHRHGTPLSRTTHLWREALTGHDLHIRHAIADVTSTLNWLARHPSSVVPDWWERCRPPGSAARPVASCQRHRLSGICCSHWEGDRGLNLRDPTNNGSTKSADFMHDLHCDKSGIVRALGCACL
jgi:hypothetical protein